MNKFEERKLKVNGLEIQVREHKAVKNNETIIFLHYSGANIAMWEPSIPYFEDSYRLILIDLRGHGKSSKPNAGYHINDMASDVIEVMKELNVNKAHLVGSSMGAEVGLVIAAAKPEKVESLICEGALYSEFGPYGIFEGSESDYKTHVRTSLKKYEDRPEFAGETIDHLIGLNQHEYEESGIWNKHFERIERYGAYPIAENQYVSSMSKSILYEYMTHYYTYQFENYYEKITCPVLMMAVAEPESKREVVIMNDLCKLTQNCKIASIDGWQHAYGWLLQTKEACETALNFIREQ